LNPLSFVKKMMQSLSDTTEPLPQLATPKKQRAPLCYGRLKDLEMMVPAHWWTTIFADSMYLKTDGDVIEDPEITREEIHLLESDPQIKSILDRSGGTFSP
jgi:hypothetical protein